MWVFSCAWKINFPKIIFSWLGVLKALTRKLFEVKIFTSNHFRTLAQRERERESPDHSLDRAPIWRPKELQSDDHKPVSSRHTSANPHEHQSNKDQLQRRSILPLSCDLMNFFSRFCFTCVSIWSDLMNFFLSFVSFVFLYWGMILYICLAAEKMYSTSRKCVFYGIFKNTTKYQKIFFKTFFKMQPNTWKYFPFPKIAFSENILHEPNTALNMTYGLGLYICV